MLELFFFISLMIVFEEFVTKDTARKIDVFNFKEVVEIKHR